MKKIVKLFFGLFVALCFANLVGATGEYANIQDVKNNYAGTNFMEALLIESRKEDPNVDLVVTLDETNHKMNLASEGEVFMSFDYTDEYIAFHGTAPTNADEAQEMAVMDMVYMIYSQNVAYAILDTFGYTLMDFDVPDDTEFTDEFYNTYGLSMTEQDYSFTDGDEAYNGTYISELKVSLSKDKINKLLEDYGTERPDYISSVNGVSAPEISLKKKGSAIVVSWGSDPAAVRYKVYRADKKDGTYKKIATVTTNSYKDTKVTYGNRYYYKVRAVGEDSGATSEIKSLKLKPAQVKNVRLTNVGTNNIKVNYDKESETGYVIERSTDGKSFSTVKTITKKDTLSYKDTGLKANKRYYYRVRAYKQVGYKIVYGDYSEIVSVKTAPAKPTVTVKTDTYETLRVYVTESKGASRYEIYRSTKKDGTYNKVTDITGLKYTDDNLKYGKTYYYKVKACNSNNKCSGLSSVASKKVELQKPKITLETSKSKPVTITVSNNKGTDGFVVYRATSKYGEYKKIKDLFGFSNTYQDTTAKKDKTYYYKVKTYAYVGDEKKYSAVSDIQSIKSKYDTSSVQTVSATSANDFNGVYKKGTITMKIYTPASGDTTVWYDNTDGFGGVATVSFEKGKLAFDLESNDFVIQLTSKGIYVSGTDNLNGEYSKNSDYTFDDYFADNYGDGEYLNTKYNGRFEDADGKEAFLFQKDDWEVKVRTEELAERFYIDEDEDMASGHTFFSINDYRIELEVHDEVLTIRYYDEDTDDLIKTETYNRVNDLSKAEIVEFFS